MLVTEEEIESAFRFLYERAKLAVRAGRRGRRRGRSLAGQGRGRERSVAVVSGGNVSRPNRLCYPGPTMKADIHPEYVLAHVTAPAATSSRRARRKPELHVEICSDCHPFYTGKQKLMDTGGRVERFQRRLEKAGAPRARRALATVVGR